MLNTHATNHALPYLSPMAEKRTAAVIGSGFGGLAAAVRLLKRGYSVDLYEKLNNLGGRARVIEHAGIAYDGGPTVITAPSLLAELFALHGEQMSDHIEMLPVEPWYRMMYADGSKLDMGSDLAALEAQIAAFHPADLKGFRDYLTHCELLYQKGYVELGDRPFLKLWDMLKTAPDLIRLRADRSVHALVSHYVHDERLIRALSVPPLLVGGHPYRTTSILSLIHPLERREGVHFARGGTAAIVRALGALIERHGGRIHLNTRVAKLHTQAGLVRSIELENGQQQAVDVVVANADPATVEQRLLSGRAPSPRKAWSMGLLVLYFTTRGRWPGVEHHTILFGEQFKRLLDDIFDGASLNSDLSLYLHRPSATDEGICAPDEDVFYVLAPVPNLRQKIDWKIQGPRVRERVLEILQERILPGLRERLKSDVYITPEYFADELESPFGCGFSLAPTLTQSAWFRPHNRHPQHSNLYFVGAGTHPGAGVPGVLTSAKVLERLLP